MKELYGYKILGDGTVLSKRDGSPLKWADNGKGYLISVLSVEGRRRSISHHRMVAEAYHGPCPKGYEVGHKDDDRSNNHPDNLEYVTKSQNNQQSWDNGNRCAAGEYNANAKVTEVQVRVICQYLQDNKGCNISEVSRKFQIGRGTISAIKNGKQWVSSSCDYIFV